MPAGARVRRSPASRGVSPSRPTQGLAPHRGTGFCPHDGFPFPQPAPFARWSVGARFSRVRGLGRGGFVGASGVSAGFVGVWRERLALARRYIAGADARGAVQRSGDSDLRAGGAAHVFGGTDSTLGARGRRAALRAAKTAPRRWRGRERRWTAGRGEFRRAGAAFLRRSGGDFRHLGGGARTRDRLEQRQRHGRPLSGRNG